MEQTNDVIFEWRADTDQLVFSPSWGKRFGYATNESGVMLGRLYRRYIRDKDIDQFEKLLSGLREGERYSETEVRLIDSAGNYRWCRFRITVMRGHDGSVSRAIGLITDVDNERRTIQQLRNMAERDSLTRLYNKNVARQKINACISSMRGDDFAAMFVIDVDDFKRINDHYGHMLGDTVLQKVAGELESVFRPEDIVARIGGDEFLVFMTAIHDSRIIEERATRINTILKNVIIQTIPDHTISCSIGLVLCPEGGSDFDELFIHGDLALYDAKRKGKNQHSFYMPSMNNAEFEVAAESIIGENEAETTGV
jgi:putative two-component system response regulator